MWMVKRRAEMAMATPFPSARRSLVTVSVAAKPARQGTMEPMTYFPLTAAQHHWRDVAQTLADDVLGPRAADTDRDATFPAEQLAALRAAGLMGLRGDPDQGGAGEGLLTTCLVTETLAAACPSSALVYKMHLESVEMICRVPTGAQRDEFVPRLVSGEWLSTVAGSEAGHRGGGRFSSSRVLAAGSAPFSC
jgi:alkylation response protein AidB-like acyl-CoA dehydrogenase